MWRKINSSWASLDKFKYFINIETMQFDSDFNIEDLNFELKICDEEKTRNFLDYGYQQTVEKLEPKIKETINISISNLG
jgi:hypothetical protein